MKKVFSVFVTIFLASYALTAFASGEGPLSFPSIAKTTAKKHNQEGIAQWNKGNVENALMHFQVASKIDGVIGESHFNEAICLDKLGEHKAAAAHFNAARSNAHGNMKILQSRILNAHLAKASTPTSGQSHAPRRSYSRGQEGS